MRILTICPSKDRPEQLSNMAKSWVDTVTEPNHAFATSSEGTVTECINTIWKDNLDADFFHVTNDDVIYHSKGWDTQFVNFLKDHPGIAYGNDLFQGINMPTFPFISAALPKAVGWLQMPTLNRYCGDLVWADIGKTLHNLYYFDDIKIEHMHKLAGKGNTDVDMEVYAKDVEAYVKWSKLQRHVDTGKIMGVLNG